MKTDFAVLIKNMRVTLRPVFQSIRVNADASNLAEVHAIFDEIEAKKAQMVTEAGYTQEEFDKLEREHYMDFSSDNPDEWVIRHDPENPVVIHKH